MEEECGAEEAHEVVRVRLEPEEAEEVLAASYRYLNSYIFTGTACVHSNTADLWQSRPSQVNFYGRPSKLYPPKVGHMRHTGGAPPHVIHDAGGTFHFYFFRYAS